MLGPGQKQPQAPLWHLEGCGSGFHALLRPTFPVSSVPSWDQTGPSQPDAIAVGRPLSSPPDSREEPQAWPGAVWKGSASRGDPGASAEVPAAACLRVPVCWYVGARVTAACPRTRVQMAGWTGRFWAAAAILAPPRPGGRDFPRPQVWPSRVCFPLRLVWGCCPGPLCVHPGSPSTAHGAARSLLMGVDAVARRGSGPAPGASRPPSSSLWGMDLGTQYKACADGVCRVGDSEKSNHAELGVGAR